MTREEAIEYLNNLYMALAVFPNQQMSLGNVDEMKESVSMAIKALEQEPCDDAISRQAVFELVRSLTRWCVRSEDGKFNNVGLLYDDVMFGIDKLSPVNPQPKTGHWINTGLEGEIDEQIVRAFSCSECGAISIFRIGYKELINSDLCPNCGRQMVEQQERSDKE